MEFSKHNPSAASGSLFGVYLSDKYIMYVRMIKPVQDILHWTYPMSVVDREGEQ
jgi:hypothetical protein